MGDSYTTNTMDNTYQRKEINSSKLQGNGPNSFLNQSMIRKMKVGNI